MTTMFSPFAAHATLHACFGKMLTVQLRSTSIPAAALLSPNGKNGFVNYSKHCIRTLTHSARIVATLMLVCAFVWCMFNFFLTGWCRGHISLTQSRYSQWVISKSSPTGLWWRRPLPSRGTIESYMWVLKEFSIDVIRYSIALYCQRYYYFLELTIAVFMTRFTIHDTFHDS